MINQETAKGVFMGDGNSTEFSVPFTFLANAAGEFGKKYQIKVFLTDPLGAQTLLNEDTDYEVEGQTLRLFEAPKENWRVIVVRDVPLSQPIQFWDEKWTQALDKLTMAQQMLAEQLERALLVPEGDTQNPGAQELVAQIRALYGEVTGLADEAKEQAQAALEAAVNAYEQAEKLYAHREDYTAGTAFGPYDGDLSTFDLNKKYLADANTLKVFVNGVLKIPAADYTEVINPDLAEKGNPYGQQVLFTPALQTGDNVTFMWGDTLTMPGGEVAQRAAEAAASAESSAQAALASVEEAQKRLDKFLPKQVGELYFSQSKWPEDNLGALPGWTGETVTDAHKNYPGLWNFVKKHPELCLEQSAYSQMLAEHGHVPFYVIDEVTGTLTLPIYRRFIAAVREDEKRGAFKDTMRPITGKLGRFFGNNNEAEGALEKEGFPNTYGNDGSGTWEAFKMKLNSANLGEHYNGEETQPAHAREYPWIVAFNITPNMVAANGGVVSMWSGTQTQYESRTNIPPTQLCLVYEEEE